MNYHRIVTCAILLLGASLCPGEGQPLPATHPTATQPATTQAAPPALEALNGFFAAIRAGDANEALKSVATFDRPDDPMLLARLRRLAQQKRAPVAVLAVKETARAAVAVVREDQPGAAHIDIDPIYLIRRGDRFLVMPGLSRYQGGIVKLTPEEEADFRELDRWYKEQETASQRQNGAAPRNR